MTNAGAAVLAGRAVLVTGGSSGIGRAIALAAARAGADVALTFQGNEKGARGVEREIHTIGRRAVVLHLDLRDDRSAPAAGEAAIDALGRLDVWVNNAGADILTGPAASWSEVEKLDLLLAVDLRGAILASWYAARLLGSRDEGGVIINISSIAGIKNAQGNVFGLMPHPERCAEAVLGGVDGRLIFESVEAWAQEKQSSAVGHR